jgi:[ribosomal protein S5]-alanine N-acetyltransferase
MSLSEPFSTERLKFRLLQLNDLEAIYRQFSDPDMCKYFSDPPCDREEAKGIIEHYQSPEGKGHLRYGMFDIITEKFIGTCGYHYLDNDLKQVEIGYDIWKDYWRKGYISEALPVLLHICFEELEVECIYILADPQNKASIKSVSKFGFVECKPCRELDVEPQICMKLLRTEWYKETILEKEFTNGLGRISLKHPMGTFSLTPASYILIEAITNNKEILNGIGIDWGTGIGCLAILAAKIELVDKVYGLDISKENIYIAAKNAKDNNVTDKVCFMLADSYSPFNGEEKQEFDKLRGKVNFILSNPPSSDWDDGFGFRRIVLEGAREYLVKNGIVLLNISFQYGMKRVESLHKSMDGYNYMGVAASTDWVPFDLSRPDLLECLKIYSGEEVKGGLDYTFLADRSSENNFINAQTALDNYNKRGVSPLTQWQTHMFQYIG